MNQTVNPEDRPCEQICAVCDHQADWHLEGDCWSELVAGTWQPTAVLRESEDACCCTGFTSPETSMTQAVDRVRELSDSRLCWWHRYLVRSMREDAAAREIRITHLVVLLELHVRGFAWCDRCSEWADHEDHSIPRNVSEVTTW